MKRSIKAATWVISRTCEYSLLNRAWKQQLIQFSGPNWIHGTDHNPILDLAKETATTTFHPNGESTHVYDESGKLLDEQKAARHTELFWGILGKAFEYSNQESASIPQERSLMDYFHTIVKEKKLDEDSSTLVLQLASMWGDFIGDTVETQSLKYLWLEECIDGGSEVPI